MSYPVVVTADEVSKVERELKKKRDIICLDETAHLKTLLIAREMLMRGKDVPAKVIKGY